MRPEANTVHCIAATLGRVLATMLQRVMQRFLQPYFSNGKVACLHYEHCGATSVRV
jgi:hypothetical protein